MELWKKMTRRKKQLLNMAASIAGPIVKNSMAVLFVCLSQCVSVCLSECFVCLRVLEVLYVCNIV